MMKTLARCFWGFLAIGLLASPAACGSDDSPAAPANTGGQAGSGGSDNDAQAGTGGGGTGGEGGQAGQAGSGGGSVVPPLEAACKGSCDKVVATACSAGPSWNDCMGACMGTMGQVPDCETQAIALLDCSATTGTVTCDANGVPASSGCEAQTTTLNECTVCEPVADDGPCKLCGKDKCCNEAKALVTEPTTSAYVACAQACGDQACINGCKSTYPAAAAATQAAAQCVSTQCSSECGG